MSELSRAAESAGPGAGSSEPPSPNGGAPDAGASALRWLPAVHGGLTIVFGCLLLFIPGRTLVFFATLAGISLCLLGLIQLVTALRHGLTGGERVAQLGMALLAGVAGIVVIARPEGSIKTIAVVTGIYLLIMGVTTLVLGSPDVRRGVSLIRGGLALVAGVILLVWPDITVGVAAAIYGAFLVALGAAELTFGLRMRRAYGASGTGD